MSIQKEKRENNDRKVSKVKIIPVDNLKRMQRAGFPPGHTQGHTEAANDPFTAVNPAFLPTTS